MGGRCWDWWNRVPEGVEATNAFFRSQSQEHSLQRISYCWKEWGSSAAAFHEDHTELMNCISVCYHIITYHYIIIYNYHYHDVLYRFSAESYLWLIYRWFMFLQHSSVSIGLAMWHPDVDFPASGLRRRVQTCRRPHLFEFNDAKKTWILLSRLQLLLVIFFLVKLMPLCGNVNGKHHFYSKIRGRSVGWCTPKTIVYPQNGAVVEDLIFYLLTLDLGNWFYRITLQVTEPGSMFRPKF